MRAPMAAFLQNYKEKNLQNWLDEPIPMLNNHTPRTASITREGRVKLNDLLDYPERMSIGQPASMNVNPSREWVYQ